VIAPFRPQEHRDNDPALPRRLSLIVGIICLLVLALLDISAISRSTNSTAAIGYIFLPITVGVLSIPGFVAGWCLGYFLLWWKSPVRSRRALAFLAGAVPLTLAAWVTGIVWNGLHLTAQVHDILKMDARQLAVTIDDPTLSSNKFVLGAIAENRKATPEVLHRIATLDRPELHKAMGSHFDVMGTNRKGLAVMRLVARHPNTAPEDLAILANSTDPYVAGDIAGNPKVSGAVLDRFQDNGNYLIDWGLAHNPNTPAAALSRLSVSQNEYTRTFVAANPSLNMDILADLAKDASWMVRRNVAMNPATPPAVLETLRNDPDERVRRSARSRQ
jgi:hypothetical protein